MKQAVNFATFFDRVKQSINDRPFTYGMTLVVLCAAGLRFWNLGDINKPVFDEVYFPKYAYDYMTGTRFFHVHPPLANYIIMVGEWVYHHLPWVDEPKIGTVPFEQINAVSYRWLNAAFGTFLAFIIGLFAYRLSGKRLFGILAGSFAAIEGSMIVSSRFGLNSVFLVTFGILALYYALKAVQNLTSSRLYMVIAGMFLGCVISIKWNGLAFSLVVIALLLGYKLFQAMDIFRPAKQMAAGGGVDSGRYQDMKFWEFPIYLIILPVVVYSLLYIPDRMFNTEHSFLEMHRQILWYHGSHVTADEHPYCSKWYTWPLQLRPIGYFFESRNTVDELGNSVRMMKDIHLLGNPFLYWFSTVAIVVMVFHWLYMFWQWFKNGVTSRGWFVTSVILMGFFGNLLPWSLVSRCIFLYHYQSALAFALLALAWYIYLMFTFKDKRLWVIPGGLLLAIAWATIFFLPVQLGIEIESSQFYNRMWLKSWI